MFYKRLFDIFASIVGLLIFLPILLVVTILIRIKMGDGPIFFTQERVGRYGKLFIIVKFRTMIIGHNGNTISVEGETRITSFGAFLRKYKLDELPELWNILKGDMSFVGPRPDVPGYADKLSGEEKKILELRPGLTGPASLKYSNEEKLLAEQENPEKYNDVIIWPDKVRINLGYYYNHSFFSDIIIIIRTLFRKNDI